MKRYWCSKCQRQVRVNQLPGSVETPAAEVVTDRVGVCRHHDRGDGVSRRAINDRARVRHTRTKAVMAPSTPPKSKKK